VPEDRNKNNTFFSQQFHVKLPKSAKSKLTVLVELAGDSDAENTVAPVLTGTGQVGNTLSLSNGTWTNGVGVFLKTWYRDSEIIAGATGSTYDLVAADDGHTITGYVTDKDADDVYAVPVASNSIAVAYPAPSAANGLGTKIYEIGQAITSLNVAADFTGSGITYALDATSAALPPGLSLSGAGAITGTPTDEILNVAVVVRGTNSGGYALTTIYMTTTEAPVLTLLDLDNTVDPAVIVIDPSESGVIYWMVDTNASRTAAQIVAGGGSAGGAFAVTEGLIEEGLDLSDVPGGSNYIHFVEQDNQGLFGDVLTYTLVVSDVTAPTLTTKTPADGATGIALGVGVLTAVFSENIVFGTGNIVIRRDTGGGFADWETFNVATEQGTSPGQVNIVGDTLYIYPTTDLTEADAFAVRIASTAIDDTSANSYAGIANDTDWNFAAVADVTGPTLSSTTPTDGATGVALTDSITMTFNEDIAFGTGNITLRVDSGGGFSDLELFDVATEVGSGNGQVQIVDNVLTINPTASFTAGYNYAIRIAATAIDDVSGNSYAGIANDTTLNFTAVSSIELDPIQTIESTTTTAGLTQFESASITIGSGSYRLIVVRGIYNLSAAGTTKPVPRVTFGAAARTLGDGLALTVHAQSAIGVNGRPSSFIAVGIAPSSGAGTVQIDIGGTTFDAAVLVVEEWEGGHQTTPVVDTDQNYSGATSVNQRTATLDTTGANQVLIGICRIAGNLDESELSNSSGTEQVTGETGTNSTTDSTYSTANKNVASASTDTLVFDWTTSANHAAVSAVALNHA
jgi:methionine-rich copper-binding protein CopC